MDYSFLTLSLIGLLAILCFHVIGYILQLLLCQLFSHKRFANWYMSLFGYDFFASLASYTPKFMSWHNIILFFINAFFFVLLLLVVMLLLAILALIGTLVSFFI